MVVSRLVPCPASQVSGLRYRWAYTGPGFAADRPLYRLVASTSPPANEGGIVWFAGDRPPGVRLYPVCFQGVPFVLAVSVGGEWNYRRPGRLLNVDWSY